MPMKKFINDPANLTAELLEGFTMCYKGKVKVVSDKIVVRTVPKDASKVAIVTLGAAGNDIRAEEKLFSELDAAAGGDGDHGTAIVTAFNAMDKAEGQEFRTYLKALSEGLQNEACGSTSTLYGSWLQGMSEASPANANELDADGVAAMFRGGVEEIGAVVHQGMKPADALQLFHDTPNS